jgi:hypothetical protein
MPHQISISAVTGTPPYSITICDTTLVYCYLITGSTTIPPTFTFDVPPPLDVADSVIVKIMDSNGCQLFYPYSCPIIPCDCITLSAATEISGMPFTMTLYPNGVVNGKNSYFGIEPNSIAEINLSYNSILGIWQMSYRDYGFISDLNISNNCPNGSTWVNNYGGFAVYSTLGTICVTPTPTPTLTPTGTCRCIQVTNTGTTTGTFYYTQCDGTITSVLPINSGTTLYYCGSNPVALTECDIYIGDNCVSNSCVSITPTPSVTPTITPTPSSP